MFILNTESAGFDGFVVVNVCVFVLILSLFFNPTEVELNMSV